MFGLDQGSRVLVLNATTATAEYGILHLLGLEAEDFRVFHVIIQLHLKIVCRLIFRHSDVKGIALEPNLRHGDGFTLLAFFCIDIAAEF